MLEELKEKHGVIRIKGGTEVEDLSFPEIAFIRKITRGIFPMTVKIGGPEARNDIRFILENGIDTVLGPMIESVYGLKNFIECTTQLEEYYQVKVEKAINIETIETYQSLDAIFASPYFKEVASITVGRSDLSGSMNKDVDDPEVIKITRDIVQRAGAMGKKTSVGGKITTKNIEMIKKDIGPDRVNTRHIVYDLSQSMDFNSALVAGLLFEIELYQAFKKICPSKRVFYENRIQDTKGRAGLG